MSLLDRFISSFRTTDRGGSEAPGLVQQDDGSVVYIKPDGSRVEVGGGGSTPFAGARVTLLETPGWTGSAIPFSTLDWDSDGYWNADTFKFVIPVGKAGLYSLTGLIYISADPAITSGLIFVEGNDPDPEQGSSDFPLIKYLGTNKWLAPIAIDIYGHEGDEIYLDGAVNGPDDATVFGYASLVYRGAPTLLL